MCSAFARAWFGKEIDSVNTGKLIPEGAPPRPTCFLTSDWLTPPPLGENLGVLAVVRRECFISLFALTMTPLFSEIWPRRGVLRASFATYVLSDVFPCQISGINFRY